MRTALRAPLLFAFGCALTACTISNEGITPPQREFHYPIAAAISADSHWLYVVNSDFNLQYNGARVNVVDLNAVRGAIDAGQTSTSAMGHEAEVISNGAHASVQINPFATAAMLRPAMDDGNGHTTPPRLYITVRGDGSMTYFDAVEDQLLCRVRQPDGSVMDSESSAACAIGGVPGGPRNLSLPPLPVTLFADNDVDNPFVVVVHQESPRARASLFYDPPGQTPLLVHYVGDLSPNLGAVVRAPRSLTADASSDPHYFAFSRLEPTVNQLRARNDEENSYLYRTRLDLVPDLSTDVGIRSVVMDPRNDVMGSGICRMYATARPGAPDSTGATHSPEQLISFDICDPDRIRVLNIMPLPSGPSNLTLVPPDAMSNAPMLAYVVSYDARKMYVIDVDHWREYDEIRTNRGPHWPVYDKNNHHLYLVDFAAMVVEVIDVNAAHTDTFDHVIFTIGDTILPDLT